MSSAACSPLTILYVGPLRKTGTCYHRLTALQELGHAVIPIDTFPAKRRTTIQSIRFWLVQRFRGPIDFTEANNRMLDAARNNRIAVAWIDKGVTIRTETLAELKKISPSTVLCHYNPDDPFGRASITGMGWRFFMKSIPNYDIHFVPRRVNVKEYESRGAKKVVFFFKGFDPLIHRPIPVTQEDRIKFGGQVGFIGEYEKERAQSILYLAENGIQTTVWGKSWARLKHRHENLTVQEFALWNDDYARAICSFDIVLAFLRKANRDQHTSRSLEIPACGAFMLAERTEDHQELFEEGIEAEFFSTKEELLAKVTYYLGHPVNREAIAVAGRERCLRGGYSNRVLFNQLIELAMKQTDTNIVKK